VRSKHQFETLEQVQISTPFLWDSSPVVKEEVDLHGMMLRVELNASTINALLT